jgi:hypothetical protein
LLQQYFVKCFVDPSEKNRFRAKGFSHGQGH